MSETTEKDEHDKTDGAALLPADPSAAVQTETLPNCFHDLSDLPQWNAVHEQFDELGIPTATMSEIQRMLHVSAMTAMRLKALYSAVENVRHTRIICAEASRLLSHCQECGEFRGHDHTCKEAARIAHALGSAAATSDE
jgi:hypothetical protein